MKVLIDTSPLTSGHALRGIGTYTRLLTAELEKKAGIQVVRSGTEQAEKFDPDLIHYPYFDLFFSTLPVVRKKPAVVTVHDVIPLRFPQYYPAGIRGTAKLIKQKTALKGVRAVITDSQASQQDINHYLGISLDKIQVIPLAANPKLTKATPTEINRVNRQYRLPKSYVLYVGDINYNKNIPQLIKSVRKLPRHTKLVCVGKNFIKQDIPEWQWIETQMAMSDVASRVRFINHVRGDAVRDLAAIYTAAECYVQPSLYEGFGLPVLEAMQCLTPVVATNTSSLPEVAGEHAVMTGTQAEEIAAGVNQVLSWSQTKRNEVTRAAYMWSQKFSWQQVAAETVRIYRRALKK